MKTQTNTNQNPALIELSSITVVRSGQELSYRLQNFRSVTMEPKAQEYYQLQQIHHPAT